MLQNFVPQIELLYDSRLMSFVSHGGGNSIVESIYYGKPMICFPQGADQIGTCYRVNDLGAGINVGSKPTAESLKSAVEEITKGFDQGENKYMN